MHNTLHSRGKILLILIFCLSIGISARAESVVQDSTVVKVDSTFYGLIGMLDEVVITGTQKGMKIDDYLRLRRRVYKVWPYAVLAAEYLQELDEIRKDATKREFRKTVNERQDQLYDNFEGILKKFTRSEGRVLIKLVYRQTGISVYDIARDLKSGWKAFWWNSAASMFSLSLKDVYMPMDDVEDYNIEMILHDYFDQGTLMYTPSHLESMSYFYSDGDKTSPELQELEERASKRNEKRAQRKKRK